MKDNTLSWMSGDGVNRKTNRFAGNQSGKTAVVNAGRGPTVGNTSNDKTPGSHSMPKATPGKEMTMGCHQPQVRTPGGVKEMPKTGRESFNFSRGPTKGNA